LREAEGVVEGVPDIALLADEDQVSALVKLSPAVDRQSVNRGQDRSREHVQRGEVAQPSLKRRDHLICDSMEAAASVAVLIEPAPHARLPAARRAWRASP